MVIKIIFKCTYTKNFSKVSIQIKMAKFIKIVQKLYTS